MSADPFTMRVLRHLIETPAELLNPDEYTARAQIFVALRPLVTLIAEMTADLPDPDVRAAVPVRGTCDECGALVTGVIGGKGHGNQNVPCGHRAAIRPLTDIHEQQRQAAGYGGTNRGAGPFADNRGMGE